MTWYNIRKSHSDACQHYDHLGRHKKYWTYNRDVQLLSTARRWRALQEKKPWQRGQIEGAPGEVYDPMSLKSLPAATRKMYDGSEGRPNNLPQPAWRLVELFFWSDLSWSRADLCANSYGISMRFSLLSTMPSCTRYVSNIGIGRIIHNVLFRISMHGLFVTLDPTDFQVTCDSSYFSSFE